MNGVVQNCDAAKAQIQKIPEILVVVSGDVKELRSLARLAQQLLNDIVVQLIPIPGLPECPAVDEIADEIELVALVLSQKIKQGVCLCSARPEMDVGNEDRSVSG